MVKRHWSDGVTLLDVAKDVTPQVTDWAGNEWSSRHLNIVQVDGWQYSNLVGTIVALNLGLRGESLQQLRLHRAGLRVQLRQEPRVSVDRPTQRLCVYGMGESRVSAFQADSWEASATVPTVLTRLGPDVLSADRGRARLTAERETGLEPATYYLEGSRSARLSYSRVMLCRIR
jgi:hypothetical protein